MICPFAVWRPGPPNKVNPPSRWGKGAVLHSAEGSLIGAFDKLDSTTQVSWHFTVAVSGTIYQHYDTVRQCWHAHAAGNGPWLGIEHENEYTNGYPNHNPLNGAQLAATIRLLKWLRDAEGWPAVARKGELWEHNEIIGNATLCPSGRIPWPTIITALTQLPDYRDFAPAADSVSHFLRNGISFSNLIPADRSVFLEVADLVRAA